MLMATRLPDIPADPSEIPGIIQAVAEPNTGLSVQQRRYYDMKLGKLVESLVLLFGFNIGLTDTAVCDRLIRIIAN